MMSGKGSRVIEADVHPRGPISTSRPGVFAEADFLPRQEANLVGLLSPSQKRLFQRPSRAKNLLAF